MAGRSAIGLDIGTSGVRAAELSFGKGSVTLEKFGQVALPEGAVRDGEVVDPDAVAAAVKQLWAHTKFSSKKVVIGVANQKVIVRQVDLPWMPVDELKKSLAYQVQDFVPMPVEQAVLDFHPLEELTGENGTRVLRGLLVAASRDMVQRQPRGGPEGRPVAGHGRPHVLRGRSARSPTPTTSAWARRSRRSSTSVPGSPTSWSTRAASRASCASC